MTPAATTTTTMLLPLPATMVMTASPPPPPAGFDVEHRLQQLSRVLTTFSSSSPQPLDATSRPCKVTPYIHPPDLGEEELHRLAAAPRVRSLNYVAFSHSLYPKLCCMVPGRLVTILFLFDSDV